jgi:hypothetical protein
MDVQSQAVFIPGGRMTDTLSTLPEKAAMNLGAKTSICGETSGPYADRRHFLATMVAATGASLVWTPDSSADTRSSLPPGSSAGPDDESYWSKVRAQLKWPTIWQAPFDRLWRDCWELILMKSL